MLNEKKVIKIIAKILKIETTKVNLNSSMQSLEEWDSLAHLSILTQLDIQTKGKASRIKGLSNADSIKKIIKLLKNNKLV